MKISLIIPTYNEKENIKELLAQVMGEFYRHKIDGEIIVVDDNSPDGTGDIVEGLKTQYSNLKIVHRAGKLGLSSAVIEGFNIADGDIICVMDADLSHPVDKMIDMYDAIKNGADFVVGSRYIDGGDIKGWNLYRKILSKGATILARIFTEVRDPMSGFFMFKKELIINKDINPKGFKILLELLVKLDCKNIVEIPIVFINRTVGESKAGTKEIVYYLQNLIKYLPYKKRVTFEFIKFACVGLVGTFINVSILYYLTDYYRVYYMLSAFIAFVVAVTFNYIFNKIWTFKEKIDYKLISKYFNFLVVSLMALFVNLIFLYIFTEFFKVYYLFSQVIAIGLSLIINFIGNKIWTFRK